MDKVRGIFDAEYLFSVWFLNGIPMIDYLISFKAVHVEAIIARD